MYKRQIKKYAKAVHANGGVVICSLTLSAPWILTKLEPYCDAIPVSYTHLVYGSHDRFNGALKYL